MQATFKPLTLLLVMLLFLSTRGVRLSPLLRSSSSHVQGMYDALASIRDVPRSVAEPDMCPHVQECLSLMNAVTLEELGLRHEQMERLRDSVCMSIVQTPSFNMAVFLLPRGASLPLHDHPHMTVLSKVMHGELSMRSFSLCKQQQQNNLVAVDVVSPLELKRNEDDAFFLTPERGNIHEFVAASGAVAVLDVLMPPYNEPERPCNYYQYASQVSEEQPAANEKVVSNSRLWLKKMPPSFEPRGLPYGVQYFGSKPKTR